MAPTEKTCRKCGVTKPLSEFHKDKGHADGHKQQCKKCRMVDINAWKDKNKDKCEAVARNAANNRADRRKKEVMGAYGGKCTKCGIDDIDVLTIDHVNNNGNSHRKEMANGADPRKKGSSATYRWLEQNGYPEGFQVLCFNCNIKKHIEYARANRMNNRKSENV